MSAGLREPLPFWAVGQQRDALLDRRVHEQIAPLENLQSIVLLSGSVRQPILAAKTGRSLLDFPVDGSHSFLRYWQHQALSLATLLDRRKLPMRVLLARDSIQPRRPARIPGVAIRIERDPVEYRGIGGVLRDLAGEYNPDDYILVVNAAQLLLSPLPDLVSELAIVDGEQPDIGLISHADGTPSGLMLIRCGALDCVPEKGYIDLKEQALPVIAEHHRVSVIQPPTLSAIPVRTLSDYISALRWRHCGMATAEMDGSQTQNNAFSEQWRPTFRIVENGAVVDASAQIHDSVVLSGARVERDAVLVRSVVGPGGIVRANSSLTEQIANHR